jgi:hypothetical protein
VSPLSLMFAALLLLVIVETSALAWWLAGAWPASAPSGGKNSFWRMALSKPHWRVRFANVYNWLQ